MTIIFNKYKEELKGSGTTVAGTTPIYQITIISIFLRTLPLIDTSHNKFEGLAA